ncbi:hypothetical protein K432DRAFT_407010 [Lepidopterella palustris CBS 459.81]|uniref:Uncharacterized protein n=1 Tax=Lepidopterella palustris CBS 459.81 TaxID=1314670 RepID=A0A8E2E5Y2_9PEZI|nr:hypothetical protein K432DRAFT_407010 [Lepidopterella palustris CBS 459.81]
MACTTLVTFLFECPAAARTVELLGSWDNFTKPYSMKRDLRKGPFFWSGCYSFKDIICDGDLDVVSRKRDGALMMGGTYWYYYRIDGHDEHHDPSQKSTTFCPLLPGQRLNVLEVPFECRSRCNSASSASSRVHTLNPEDKFLTPRPAPVPLSKLDTSSCVFQDLRKRSRTALVDQATNAATYPRSEGFDSGSRSRSRSPLPVRQIKSATGSPTTAFKPVFQDPKGVNRKLTAALGSVDAGRLASAENERGRRRHARGVRELQISSPILTSRTDDDGNLVPLQKNIIPKPPLLTEVPVAVTSTHEFSPLRSHPVGPDFDFGFSDYSGVSEPPAKKVRSQATGMTVNIKSRERAQSTGSKRSRSPRGIQHSREPSEMIYPRRSLSIGKVRDPSPLRNAVVYEDPLHIPEDIEESKNEEGFSQMPDDNLLSFVSTPLADMQCPPSRRKAEMDRSLREPLLVEKELPALPSYLLPEPLFFQTDASDTLGELQVFDKTMSNPEPSSHFSLWSTTSMAYTSPTSDEGVHSPTFSSLTTSSSEIDTPQRLSDQYVRGIVSFYDDNVSDDGNKEQKIKDPGPSSYVTNDANLFSEPTFEETLLRPSLLQMDIHRPESASRRHAACFGFAEGFHGYTLPDGQHASDTTLTKSPASVSPFMDSSLSEPRMGSDADPAVSQLEQLISEFGYLGEAVL